MPLWKNRDLPNSVPIFVTSQLNVPYSANNVANTYNNNVRGAYFANANVGTWGITSADLAANSANTRIAHTGWQLKTEGFGGRAGRVFYETLVASKSMTD